MPCQKKIALALGISQSAVSKALRGHRSISTDMRKKIHDTAERMGYHLSEHVSILMSNLRTGKKLGDKGTIGLLIEARSQKDWYKVEAFRVFHQGVLQKGLDLGFRIEPFFLREPNMRVSRIDQILHARGITGIILAPPCRGNRSLDLHWERYAAIGADFGWDEQDLNRVGCDQFQNYLTSFNALLRLGYKRIGTVLDRTFTQGSRHGTKWYTGYMECQNNIPENNRIPVFASNHPQPGKKFSEKTSHVPDAGFRKWFLQWHPDVILTLVGSEKRWLSSMKLKVPEDIGLACLAQPSDGDFAGIDEKCDVVGATALELVAAQIARNEFGLPLHSKTMTIKGCWVNGATIKNNPAAAQSPGKINRK